MTPLRRQVRKEIITRALPVALSSLLQRAVGIVDIFLVGGLGAGAIAAVGIAHLMVFICMSVFWGLSSGTTVVVAQLYGAQRKEEAGKVALMSLGLGLALSMVISLAGWNFGIRGAHFLGAETAVLQLAESYIKIIFIVFTFTALVNLFSNILYGTGDTRKPLYAIILINILHVLIAYPLVYGAWGAPKLGIMGAAIAIGISEAAGAAVLLGIILRKKIFHAGPVDPGLLRQVIRVGFPIFGERILQQTGQMVYLKMIMLYGTAAYAAHQVGLAIESISFMPGLGFSIAITASVGRSLGAKQPRRAELLSQEANRFAVTLMAGMGLIFFFFPYALLRLFTDDTEVLELGTLFLKTVSILQIPLAITMVLSGTLKGAGDTKFTFFTTVVGSWGIRVPLGYLIAVVFHLPLPFVWGVMVLDWIVRMCLLIYRYRSSNWQYRSLVSNRDKKVSMKDPASQR